MNSKLLALVMLFLVVGAGLGYSISLPQIMTLQSSVSELESETSALTNNYNDLNAMYGQLRDSYDSLNATYVEMLQQYKDLLFHYNLINGPASNFTTIEDLQITFTTHRTTYYYKDPISGNVTITYLNGTALGKFGIRIQPEFGGYGAIETGAIYDVNGYGEFLLEPLHSFHYGPGIYTIYLGRIHTLDDYVVAVGHELDGTAVQVEAK